MYDLENSKCEVFSFRVNFFFLNNDLKIRTMELKFWAKLAVSVCVVSGGWI